jgi:hypothetical protein
MANRAYRKLPKLVLNWMLLYGAWLVGSGVDWFLAGGDGPMPRDLDIMIPPQHWQDACKMITGRPSFNSYGGLKAKIGGVSVDFWPMHLEEFFAGTPKNQVHKAMRLQPYTLVVEDSRR